MRLIFFKAHQIKVNNKQTP